LENDGELYERPHVGPLTKIMARRLRRKKNLKGLFSCGG